MSASAPLGRPSKNTGRVEADCTSATSTGEVVSVVISQAAATSFIHMQVLAATQVSQSMRNTGTDKGREGREGGVGVDGPSRSALVQAVLGRFFGALGEGGTLGGAQRGGGGIACGGGRGAAGAVVVGLGWHVR